MFNNSDRGLINYLLVDVLHVMDDYVPWLLREWSGNAAIWLMGIWKNVGWSMLVYLAALQGIPKERYEAAELDGCTAVCPAGSKVYFGAAGSASLLSARV